MVLTNLEMVLGLFPYFLPAFALLIVGKWFFDLTTPSYKVNQLLTEADNPAFAVAFAGYMAGLAPAISGAFFSFGADIGTNVLNIAIAGICEIRNDDRRRAACRYGDNRLHSRARGSGDDIMILLFLPKVLRTKLTRNKPICMLVDQSNEWMFRDTRTTVISESMEILALVQE